MPELPEVENARRVLLRAGLPGRSISGVQVGWAPTVKVPSLEDFVLGLHSRQVQAVNRRGKYILLPLDSGETFIIHLGMTGGVNVQPASRQLDPMVRHTFTLDDGRVLRFRDPRKFGHLWLTPDLENTLPRLGPELLSEEFLVEYLEAMFLRRSAPIKALLLDQAITPGLGNLYVDESLYQAGIHPARPAGTLNSAETAKLRDYIVSTLEAAIAVYDRAPRRTMARPSFGPSHLDHSPTGKRTLSPLRLPYRCYACPGSRHILLSSLSTSSRTIESVQS